jgi:hypothetical protein
MRIPPAGSSGRRRLAIAAGASLAAGALGLAGLAYVVRSLETPAFRKTLLDRISAAAGTRFDARTLEVSLLDGVTLEGVTLSNPPPFKGNLAAADAVSLRYRLWPLLRGRLEVSKLSAERPTLDLAMDARGVFNYERLGGSRQASTAGASALPIALVISKLALDDARIVVRDPRGALVKVEGADLDTSVRLAGGAFEGEGKLTIASLNLGGAFFVRDATAPLQASKGTLTLAPVRATVAGGDIHGDARVRLQDGFRFDATLKLQGADLQKLLSEAGAVQGMSGVVAGDATVGGTGGVGTLSGKGQLQVDDCRATQVPLLTLLSTVLRVPELARPELDECRATFTLGDGRMRTPSMSLKGPSVQLTGSGVTNLRSLAIDFDMKLALSDSLSRRIPVQELRDAFKDRGDGFVTIDFAVTGTTSAPRTDLALRLGKGAAESGLKKLLRRRFF